MSRPARRTPGIEIRHLESCPAYPKSSNARCACTPTYRAVVSTPSGKLQRAFPTLAAAKQWREDARVDLRRGSLVTGSSKTVEAAGQDWLDGVRDGSVRNKSGRPYKPSVIRSYEQLLRIYVNPSVGAIPLGELTSAEVQRMVDDLVKTGISSSTVRNALMPLRVICRRALRRGDMAVNPTVGLELPAPGTRSDRVATPEEAANLLAALPEEDRALWATALYAGLRRGELQALQRSDIDLRRRIIRVRRGWDAREGEITPKSLAGVRRVPIPGDLLAILKAHLSRKPRYELVFGSSDDHAFKDAPVYRARRVWKTAELEPIGLHQCRHTYATFMIAAGVNVKALQTFMGHSTITVTLDRYGHLLPGSEDEAATLLDDYLRNRTLGNQRLRHNAPRAEQGADGRESA